MSNVVPVSVFLEQLDGQSAKLDSLLQGQCGLATYLYAIEREIAKSLPVDPDRLYTRRDAANHFSVSIRTIDRWIRSRRLGAVRKGRSVRILGRSLKQVDRERSRPPVEVLVL